MVALLLLSPLFVWAPPLIRHQPYGDYYVNVWLLPAEEKQFNAETDFLRQQPGPALCESLLRCYYAGKPYVYDPAGATALMAAGELDSREMYRRIENREFGAIQTSKPATNAWSWDWPFPQPFSDVINRRYRIAFEKPNCVIYVPR